MSFWMLAQPKIQIPRPQWNRLLVQPAWGDCAGSSLDDHLGTLQNPGRPCWRPAYFVDLLVFGVAHVLATEVNQARKKALARGYVLSIVHAFASSLQPHRGDTCCHIGVGLSLRRFCHLLFTCPSLIMDLLN